MARGWPLEPQGGVLQPKRQLCARVGRLGQVLSRGPWPILTGFLGIEGLPVNARERTWSATIVRHSDRAGRLRPGRECCAGSWRFKVSVAVLASTDKLRPRARMTIAPLGRVALFTIPFRRRKLLSGPHDSTRRPVQSSSNLSGTSCSITRLRVVDGIVPANRRQQGLGFACRSRRACTEVLEGELRAAGFRSRAGLLG